MISNPTLQLAIRKTEPQVSTNNVLLAQSYQGKLTILDPLHGYIS